MLALVARLFAGPIAGGPVSRVQLIVGMVLTLAWSLFNRGQDGNWLKRHKYVLFVVLVMWPIAVVGLLLPDK